LLNRVTFAFAAVIAAVGLSACVSGGAPARGSGAAASVPAASPAASATPPQQRQAGGTEAGGAEDAALAARLKEICARAGGECGVAVVHVETGRVASFEGEKSMPLYSVFKLPLAVAVLKDVEGGKLRLDQKVRVEPAEVSPGTKANTDLWLKPSERTLRELLEFSIVRSDNTSSDKMLELVGGPAVVTERMRALGLRDVEVRANVREVLKLPDHPNRGTASGLARLLALLQKGEVLQPAQLEVLFGLMGRAATGERRQRAGTPRGTPVADKTGTGPATTNDVGVITLPEGRGHLAVAALLNGSRLSAEKQEDVIAELARAAYDAHAARPAAGR
jgi:beta-lactamase class A